MNQLVPIQENDNGEVVVSGRMLHKALEVKTEYKDWFPRMLKYGFEENQDYISVVQKVEAQKRARTYEQIDHVIKLDMAKEISMIQRSEPGKKARQYFIQVEKHWNSPEMIMKRALQIADKKIISLEEKIALDKPKVLFADALTTSNSSILIGELAKLLKQNGVEIGQNKLFEWLRANGYLIKKKGELYNLPTQYSMDLGLMDIKKRVINNADGSTRTTRTTKVTGKGQQYFINKFLNTEMII
ncbi:phage antirepressor KilAC domain-containing protein [Macrococcoides canis]|uniref:phage antirepressor KilAC domain-containing protein n=1 Tax=Macrococcoides canis TaxID=1855823 RepID=UPI001F28EDC4|nr:phage antirepressor KilAC domain-containing protein [Macrococcus canis]UJS28454.1 phage antirepressor KilAC domain-containing protein [Macrococcus canis]